MFALSLPVIIGFLGLGSEVGYWYVNQRDMQTAADFGAFSSALVLRKELSDDYAKTQGELEARENGADAGDVITTNIPPLTGSYTGDTAAEMLIVRTLPRLFSGIFIDGDMSISVRAVGLTTQGGPACILALETEEANAIDISGNANITLAACDVQSNSSNPDAARVTGNAMLTTGCISAPGEIEHSSGLILTDCNEPSISDAAPDPYKDLAVPSDPADCASGVIPTGDPQNFSPGRFCGGLHLQDDVNLAPGVYIMDGGDFQVNASAVVNGTGVTIILTGDGSNNGTVSMNGSAQVNLAAPTDPTNPLAGILFFQDRNAPESDTNMINGNANSTLEGVIYFPTQSLTFNGNNASGPGCMHLVARMVKVTGSTTLGNDCLNGNPANFATRSVGSVALVE